MTLRSGRAAFLFTLAVFLVLLAGCEEKARPVEVLIGGEAGAGVFWRAAKDQSPAVLLISETGSVRENWQSLAIELHGAGFGVLVMDLREQAGLGSEDILRDVRAGFAFLRLQERVDAARIGFAGAGISADAALVVAAEDPLVQTVVLLSPKLQLPGLFPDVVMKEYGHRPLLIVTGGDDEASSRAGAGIAKLSLGEAVVKSYPGPARGTGLLGAGAARDVVAFLRSNL